MKALTNATFTNFGLRKFTTFSHFQISFLHLIFIYLKLVTDAQWAEDWKYAKK